VKATGNAVTKRISQGEFCVSVNAPNLDFRSGEEPGSSLPIFDVTALHCAFWSEQSV
jgi:hypothetical protein